MTREEQIALNKENYQNERRKVIKVLGDSGNKSVVQTLVILIEEPQLRHVCITALFKLGAFDKVFPWLYDIKRDSAGHIRSHFKHIINWIAERPLDEIKGYLKSEKEIGAMDLGLRIM